MYDLIGCEFVSDFKPSAEEPVAVNNLHRLRLSKDGEGLTRGTQVGEGTIHEVAAYLLDNPSSAARYSKREGEGFAGVPLTTMVKLHERFNHPRDYKESVKIGSLQMYIKNRGTCEDIDSRDFPVREVHKIFILDIRLANVDRHAGNILMTTDDEDRIVLVPVNHGNCLPKNFEQCFFVWLDGPQAKQPYSPDMIECIKTLDAEDDIKLLKQYGWDVPDECVRVLRVSTMLLKKGAARGLTPWKFLHKESVIEQIIQEAKKDSLPESTEAAFLEAVSSFVDRHLSEVS